MRVTEIAPAALANRTASASVTALGQRHSQRAVEGIAGRGRIDWFDLETGHELRELRRRHERAARRA